MRSTNLTRLAFIVLIAWASMVRADTIASRSAELRLEEDHYVLDADFDVALNPTLEEALTRGNVPLYFVMEFDLWRPRLFWFDDLVAKESITYRVSYNALTRQYRLSTGGAFYQTLASLDEVLRIISRLRGRPVVEKSALQNGVRYDAAVRLRLDTTQLPKPFQITALTSRDWNLQSEWVRWSFTP